MIPKGSQFHIIFSTALRANQRIQAIPESDIHHLDGNHLDIDPGLICTFRRALDITISRLIFVAENFCQALTSLPR